MCLLKVYSENKSFKSFVESTKIPICKIFEKGDFKNELQKSKYDDYGIFFNISDKKWNDLEAQIKDVIEFIESNFNELELLMSNYHIKYAFLDFPLDSRFNKNVAVQTNHLPPRLINLVSKLNLGIELAIYDKNRFY
ncbi:hypothetical protein [Epilithonimonas sp.]|uniref:hypothetical protein n=1 Tax=Epilithonimonas sp. TaxID=2894511 RepID=UPI00289A27A6|nr:hypothetical protein [Epilithonimonas sp.]